MGRYGKYSESSCRGNFEEFFDFSNFNTLLIQEIGSNHFVSAFDPSYMPKSGKHTHGLGKFWSGCAGAMKKGMEIGGFSVVDIGDHTAYHLDAIQTPTAAELKERDVTLLEYYGALVVQKAPDLLQFSRYLAVDAYFSRKPFIVNVCPTGLHIISRFRDDAKLFYIYKGPGTGKRGGPRKYDGKVNPKNIDKAYFSCCHEDEDCRIYDAIVYSKSLDRTVRIAYTEYLDENQNVGGYKIYFSTDLNLVAWYIVWYYKCRFQQEFLYRDGKQHTGLTDAQARGQHKLDFHFNTALSSVNVAKAKYWTSIKKDKRQSFSMTTVKTIEHNELILSRFCEAFDIDPNTAHNNPKIKELIYFGAIAA